MGTVGQGQGVAGSGPAGDEGRGGGLGIDQAEKPGQVSDVLDAGAAGPLAAGVGQERGVEVGDRHGRGPVEGRRWRGRRGDGDDLGTHSTPPK